MKILHLTLEKKWFDMIASGEKLEEYRTIKPYWDSRLNKHYDAVLFRNGYSKYSPKILIELKSITQGLGNVVWGAPLGERVYKLELGCAYFPPPEFYQDHDIHHSTAYTGDGNAYPNNTTRAKLRMQIYGYYLLVSFYTHL